MKHFDVINIFTLSKKICTRRLFKILKIFYTCVYFILHTEFSTTTKTCQNCVQYKIGSPLKPTFECSFRYWILCINKITVSKKRHRYYKNSNNKIALECTSVSISGEEQIPRFEKTSYFVKRGQEYIIWLKQYEYEIKNDIF